MIPACRDRAIMELLYSSGLRLAELVGLDLGDLNAADRTVRVLGKGSKTRVLPVGRKALDALAQWLQQRPGLVRGATDAVFVGSSGRRPGARGPEAGRVLGGAAGAAHARPPAPLPALLCIASA